MADTNIYIKEDFYPRPRVEGDSSAKSCGGRPSVFLPTPSRGGRPKMHIFSIALAIISTHALAWRATSLSQTSLSQKSRFLPTPSHGGRLCQVHGSTTPRRFLPTPSHGGRRVGLLAGSLPSVISTHALTWRATFFVSPFHIGCIFLPTPSHGGRLLFDSSAARSHRDFYPRPRVEGDRVAYFSLETSAISTHALA